MAKIGKHISAVGHELSPISLFVCTVLYFAMSVPAEAQLPLISPVNVTSVGIPVTFTWTGVPNDSVYELRISTDPSFSIISFDQGNITTTSYAVIDLLNATTYYWQVEAIDSGGTTNGFLPQIGAPSFTTLPLLPSVPSLLSPANDSTNLPLICTLAWNTSSNATSYEVEVSTSATFSSILIDSTVTSTSISIGPLSAGTIYYWRVQAIDLVISSGYSSPWNFTTLPRPAVPSLNSPPSGSTNLTTPVTLTWHPAANAISYELQIATNSVFSPISIDDTLSSSADTLFTANSLSFATTYYWRVQALNSAGSSGFSTASVFTTLAPPANPTLVSPSNNSSNLPLVDTLKWTASSNATRYQVEVSTSATFTATIINDSTVTSTSVVTGTLSAGTTYYWRVQAIDTAGSSGFSAPWTFMTLTPVPSTPTLISPANGATNQPDTLTFSWNASSGATKYRIQVASNSSFTSPFVDDTSLTQTSRLVSALSNSTTYYWRVEAINSAGASAWSSVWSLTTLTPVTVPSAPTLLSPANGATNQPNSISFSWNASSGAANYRFQLASNSSFSSPTVDDNSLTQPSRVVGGLSNSTTYYWRVQALNSAGASGWSSVWSFTTVTPVVAPSAPSLLSPANGATNQPLNDTLNWSASQNASLYQVQVSSSSDFSSTIFNDSAITSTSSVTGGLSGGTTYYWRVQATNSAGASGWSSVWNFTTLTPVIAPSVPSLLSPANGSTNQPLNDTLTWNASQNATRYQVQVSDSANFNSTIINDSTVTSTSKTTGGLSGSTKYYWRVEAINSAGASGWSSVWSFTTLTPVVAPSVPSLLSPANGATNQPLNDTLTWNAPQNATRYQVQVSDSANFNSTVINDSTVTSTSRIAGGLSGNTKYYWRVEAINSAGASGWSSVWSFTTLIPITAPAVPSLLSPANGATNQPLNDTLTWTTSQNATRYHVQVSSSTNFGSTIIDDSTITSTSRIAGGLSGSTTYYWRVGAINSAGASGWSSVWSFTTLTPIVAPSVPSLLYPADGATNEPLADTLSWNSSKNAQSYNLQLSASTSFASPIINDTGITTTNSEVGPLQIGGTYYWRVEAINSAGASGWSGAWTFTTVTAPATPFLLSPADGSLNLPATVTFVWDTVQDASLYHVQVATDDKFGGIVVNDSTIASDSTRIGPLAEGATYFWRVRAISRAGGWSSFTLPWSFTVYTPQSQPQFVAVVDTVNFPSYSNPSQFKSSDYRLIGIPGAGNIPIASLLHGTPGTDWQAYWDNGDTANYMVQYDSSSNFNFTIGKAFWIIKNGPFTIDSTVRSATLDSTNSVEIPLHRGWNVITDPFTVVIPWSAVQSYDSVTEQIYSFNGGFQSSASLMPGTGFYFFNAKSMTKLEVPIDTALTRPGIAAKRNGAVMSASDLTQAGWNVHMTLTSGGFTDSVAWFGVSSRVDADDNYLDTHRPHGMGFVPSVYFKHADWDSNYSIFADEIHPVFTDSSEWSFKVDAVPSRTATIRFAGLDQVPSGFEVYLFNASSNSWVNMRTAGSYSFVPTGSTTSFELMVGKDDLIKGSITNAARFEVGNNYPNPFNPSTTIPVYIASEANIKIDVYNVIGQKIAEVYNGDAAPGEHSFIWNGTDESGRELSSGVYFYRILIRMNSFGTASSYNVTHKMVFLK